MTIYDHLRLFSPRYISEIQGATSCAISQSNEKQYNTSQSELWPSQWSQTSQTFGSVRVNFGDENRGEEMKSSKSWRHTAPCLHPAGAPWSLVPFALLDRQPRRKLRFWRTADIPWHHGVNILENSGWWAEFVVSTCFSLSPKYAEVIIPGNGCRSKETPSSFSYVGQGGIEQKRRQPKFLCKSCRSVTDSMTSLATGTNSIDHCLPARHILSIDILRPFTVSSSRKNNGTASLR